MCCVFFSDSEEFLEVFFDNEVNIFMLVKYEVGL